MALLQFFKTVRFWLAASFAGLLALVMGGFALAAEGEPFKRPAGPAAEALALLDSVLDRAEADAQRQVAQKVVELIAPPSVIGETLAKALESDDSEKLSAAIAKAHEMLSFTPTAEATLPKDFPTFTPVGMIEVKTYPVRRQAVAKQFMTLFGHISKEKIAMTTPVEMEFAEQPSGKLSQQSMAFYYSDPEIGQAGEKGSVEVVDDAPQAVVAIGGRGYRRTATMDDYKQRLETWLEQNPEYEADGPLRAMGYNSPMMPRDRQFFEIQIPVKKVSQAER